MHDEPIEEVYFNWLYHKVASVMNPTPSLTFYTLLRDLHATEFVWLLSGDNNRAQDGLDIRKEFLRVSFFPSDASWMSIGCSVLEMLIALSRKAEFITDISVRDWFWTLLDNVELSHLNDSCSDISNQVSIILERFIWRTYTRNGDGGLFPLRYPKDDQRKVEIWYQLHAYLNENEIF
jgi:hypothetical protein